MAETTSTQGSGANSSSINPFKVMGAGADMLTNFLPQSTEYSGDAGNISASIDGMWDGASDIAMGFPPVGTMIGGIMKGQKFLGRAVNALGAGTDGMTTQDAILGSPLFNLTFGLVNGIFGQRSDSFTKDSEMFSQMGSSYGGTTGQADTAVSKSNKKYGLFSSGARRDANRLIRESQNQQNIMKDIQEDTNDQNLLAMSMSQQASQTYMNRLQGGYQQGMIRAAKQGALLFNKDSINRAKRFAQKGTKLNLNNWPAYILEDQEFVKFLNTCPEEIKNFEESNEVLYDLWRANGKPTDIEDANNAVISMFVTDDLGKTKINPEILYYTTLAEDDDFTISTIDEENETQQDSEENQDETQMFKDGGQLNVIPEGALHAHKHNLEEINDDLKGNITHKGIPVVSIDENGNVEQQAEVERNELILNKETTDAIEELRSKYNNETNTSEKLKIAEEAGTIFANSLIENTDDRTNLINSI